MNGSVRGRSRVGGIEESSLVAALAVLALAGCARSRLDVPPPSACPAPREPAPPALVAAMLEAAVVGPDDVVHDLDCGDGRFTIAAARRGARAVGHGRDPALLARAERDARAAGLADRVSFRREDASRADLSEATVILGARAVLGDGGVEAFREKLRPGARVVAHCDPLAGWEPAAMVTARAAGVEHAVFLWTAGRATTPPNLAPYVATPMPVVRGMLEVAGVTADDVVYDLGCGDGRIVVEAAKRYGARGVGIEYDRRLCEQAVARAAREGVPDRVEIRHEDVLEADFSDATVVAVYLLPASLARLLPKLEALPRGTRIVSHDYPIEGWTPVRTEVVPTVDAFEHRVLLWRVGEH